MKKAIQISLAQTLFSLEEDAYAKLDTYLQSVRSHFANTPGKDEIINDIEGRIAEQFLEGKHEVISISQVDAVIASMGHANEFGDTTEKVNTPPPANNQKTKKLYRNPDDSIIGGVCSGLAAYFNVDTLWVRLIFVGLTFITGFGIFLYIVLWILVPEAKTPSQKLEMTGSPVTLETLSNSVREKIAEVKDRHGSSIGRAISLPFEILRKVISTILNIIIPIIRITIGIALALSAFAAIVGLSFASFFLFSAPLNQYADFPVTEVFSTSTVYIGLASSYIALLIPAIFLFLLAISLIRKKSSFRPAVGLTLLGVWIIALSISGASVIKGGLAYQQYEQQNPDYAEVVRSFPLNGTITDLSISYGQTVTLVQGSEPSLIGTGREKDMDKVLVEQKDGTLSIKRKNMPRICIFCHEKSPKLVLTLPSLASLSAVNGTYLESAAWTSETPFVITFQSGSRGDMHIKAPELQAEVKSGSFLNLEGVVPTTNLSASSGSRIDAEELTSTHVTASATSGSSITVHATEMLNASASSGSSIRYRGNPEVVEKTSSGSSVRQIE